MCLVEICFSMFNLLMMTKVMIMMMMMMMMMIDVELRCVVLVVWLSPSDLCDYNLYILFELLLVRGFPCDDAGDVDNKDCRNRWLLNHFAKHGWVNFEKHGLGL